MVDEVHPPQVPAARDRVRPRLREIGFGGLRVVELIYLLGGSLEVAIGKAVHTLEEGDAMYFDSPVDQGYRRVGKKPCEAIVVSAV